MLITHEIFQSFLSCPTKSSLKSSGAVGEQREFTDWQEKIAEEYQRKACNRLCSRVQQEECLNGASFSEALKNNSCRLIINCTAEGKQISSCIPALERLISPTSPKNNPYIPLRFVPSEKVSPNDKILLAFDALVMAETAGELPLFGKIIHGKEQKTTKIQLTELLKTVRSTVAKISAQQTTPPQLILNKHCAECEFQARCRQIAIEKDDLSLLANMSEVERKMHNSKGIFTVTQLSYTFRPRRRPKKFADKPEKFHNSLKALAIRENKIHVAGKPELKITGTPIYLDVEGVPDQDFYYLIGLQVKHGEESVQHSFWANDTSEEKTIWTAFLQSLASVENPQIIHYGSYETVFLKRMQERYGGIGEGIDIDKLIEQAVNVLSVIYAQIYFPTYSNGLKAIAQYIGFQWSNKGVSGLKALMWREAWEFGQDPTDKQKLITYNAEDCQVLERVTSILIEVCSNHTATILSHNEDVVQADMMERESLYRFGKSGFTSDEMKYINKCA